MAKDLLVTAIAALLFLVWFMPNRPKLTVTVSPEIEAAAIRVTKELARDR